MEFLKSVVKKYTETSLIIRIVIGLVAGAILGRTMTGWTWIGILGSMFVGALRAVAPVLVFVLIISALSNGQSKLDSKFGLVLFFYIGVIQDSVETMLNSSGDVMFAATAEYATWIKEGREDALPTFLGGKRKVEV